MSANDGFVGHPEHAEALRKTLNKLQAVVRNAATPSPYLPAQTVLVEATFLRQSNNGNAILMIPGGRHHGGREEGMMVVPMERVQKCPE